MLSILLTLLTLASTPDFTPPGPTYVYPVAVPPMTVQEFLTLYASVTEEDLKADGNSKVKLILDQFMSATVAYSTQVNNARIRGEKPRGCVPESYKVETLLPALQAFTPEQKELDIRDGVAIVFDSLFPCPPTYG